MDLHFKGKVAGINETFFFAVLEDEAGKTSIADFDRNILSEQDNKTLSLNETFDLSVKQKEGLIKPAEPEDLAFSFHKRTPWSAELAAQVNKAIEDEFPDELLI